MGGPIHNGIHSARIILVGKANEDCEKIVEHYRNSGVAASKAQIINKILNDYAGDMATGDLSRRMQLLRIHFCFLSFTERDYMHGTEVQVSLRIPARDLIRDIKKFNSSLRVSSNIRELANAVIHDYMGVARVNGMEFNEYYVKLKNTQIDAPDELQ